MMYITETGKVYFDEIEINNTEERRYRKIRKRYDDIRRDRQDKRSGKIQTRKTDGKECDIQDRYEK